MRCIVFVTLNSNLCLNSNLNSFEEALFPFSSSFLLWADFSRFLLFGPAVSLAHPCVGPTPHQSSCRPSSSPSGPTRAPSAGRLSSRSSRVIVLLPQPPAGSPPLSMPRAESASSPSSSPSGTPAPRPPRPWARTPRRPKIAAASPLFPQTLARLLRIKRRRHAPPPPPLLLP
uniref:Uncharacterized protein n=1 Tax=Setaria viridis TaxID=4556 RepID=A0A4U6VXW9_SETVI|nr:hypothetical protein SEVIR_2G271464v2 [Setaria viridis]